MTDPIIIVGGGLAAVHAVRALRTAGYGEPITLVSRETAEPYDRPPLSKQYLSGAVDEEQIALFRPGEAEELAVSMRFGVAAEGLDAASRRIQVTDGEVLPFRSLLIATGSGVRRLPGPAAPAGVHYLRTKEDADALRTAMRQARRLVVLGAGFIGLEVAATARAAGLDVTVLEAARAPLVRVLGDEVGHRIAALHVNRGVEVFCGGSFEGFTGGDWVTGVMWRSGDELKEIAADLVVVGIGCAPHTEWLDGSGLTVDNGVVCDSRGRTSLPGIYAAGDVARWRNELTGVHHRMEQWQSAQEQGEIVGTMMAEDLGVPGVSSRPWSTVPYFWSDQYEHKIQFCGAAGPVAEGRQTARGWVTCFGSAEGQLTGVLAIDSPASIARGRRHVAAGIPLDQAREWLAAL